MKTFEELKNCDIVYRLDENEDRIEKCNVTNPYDADEYTIKVTDEYGNELDVFVGADETESYTMNCRWFSDKESLIDYLERQIARYTLMKMLNS